MEDPLMEHFWQAALEQQRFSDEYRGWLGRNGSLVGESRPAEAAVARFDGNSTDCPRATDSSALSSSIRDEQTD